MEISEISKLIEYSPETGLIKIKVSRGNIRCGSIMGNKRPDGYIELQLSGKRFFAHRLAYAMIHGKWPDAIDHINGIKSDNRISNLRAASVSQNNRNARKKSSSRFKGVACKNGKFVAAIRSEGKLMHLGTYLSDDEAAYRYDIAAIEFHKEFARCNFLPLVR